MEVLGSLKQPQSLNLNKKTSSGGARPDCREQPRDLVGAHGERQDSLTGPPESTAGFGAYRADSQGFWGAGVAVEGFRMLPITGFFGSFHYHDLLSEITAKMPRFHIIQCRFSDLRTGHVGTVSFTIPPETFLDTKILRGAEWIENPDPRPYNRCSLADTLKPKPTVKEHEMGNWKLGSLVGPQKSTALVKQDPKRDSNLEKYLNPTLQEHCWGG